MLDGETLTHKEKDGFKECNVNLTKELVKANAVISIRGHHQVWMSPEKINSSDDKWEEKVEVLNLNHLRLKKIACLDDLVNVRRLSMIDNEISAIEAINYCKLLEELSLENNRISKITNINHLLFLKKLDLGKNRINKIEGLTGLDNLTQLSLEDNKIKSLNGLTGLKNLMEL